MAYKDFDQWLQEKQGGRPEFIVAGQKFTARSKIPWKKFASMVIGMQEDLSEEAGIKNAEKFLLSVLVSADRERFENLLNVEDVEDDDACMTTDQVMALSEWLVDYYTGKGKDSESPSSGSPSESGRNVKRVSLDPAKN